MAKRSREKLLKLFESNGVAEFKDIQSALDYVRVVCGSLDNLAIAFAELDEQALERTTPLSRCNRDSALLRRVRILVKNEAEDQHSDNKNATIDAATTEL